MLLGLIATALPLLAVSRPGYTGWVITTAGISAVALAVRYRHAGGGLFLSAVGGTLGVVGTILCLWSLAAFYLPGHVPTMPNLQTANAASAPAIPVALPPSPVNPAPAARVVAPFDGADVDPTNQLHANLVHVAIEFGAVLQYDKAHGMLPSVLSVEPDGTVVSPGATYAKIAPYMSVEYGVTPGSYTFTVRDTVSGMAVGVDPDANKVVDR
ncbi:hypothetical protein D7I44_10305 [Gryllotalpicola protaetiae]|uniref:Uncharacterized protein n=1 Tax=Gryllotalpicola protaetiae TaxID=2419771 RepID=A0A387BSH9_9MICO|nr:hypothetical protein D7I44_10305 [Gryllotalpicola protaetiae]